MLCFATLFANSNLAYADIAPPPGNRVIQANGGQDSDTLSRHVDFYLDSSWALSIEDITGEYADKFAPLTTPSPNFGFTEDKIWLRMHVLNLTPDEQTWFIDVHENFLQYYDVYLQRANGDIEHLEQHTPSTTFSERSIAFPELATQLGIAPTEQVTLFIAYSSGGSSNISLSLHTSDSFARRSMTQTSKNFVSYGMMLILIITSVFAFIFLRLRVVFSYWLYVVVTWMFLLHSDGVAFQYLWPNAPVFNSYVSIIIGLAFAMVPYDFARVFLRTKKFHPRIDKFMRAMLVITPCIIIPTALLFPQYAKLTLMFLVFFGILAGTLAGIYASFTRFREVRFYVFAWFFGVCSAGIMNLRHFTTLDIGQNVELDSIRVSIVVDAIMMGLGVADRYSQGLRAGKEADRKNLQQARQNLHLNNRLHDLEEQFKLASELVETRDEQLKNTVHDLRQPLHALRLNVEKLRRGADVDVGAQSNLDTTFTYLETLIADHLQISVGSVAPADGTAIGLDNTALSLDNILTSIHEMFLPDAAQKGLEFKYVKTSQHSSVEPLVLMRIVTNIVSNAIKYTPQGRVLLGVRRSASGLRIEVHDTGTGLSQAQFARAKARSVRLKNAEKEAQGEGLGLSIASELAHEHDLTLYALKRHQAGTSIGLKIPYKR